jgi:hypothetical protein
LEDLLDAAALADRDVVTPIEPGSFLRGNPSMKHRRSYQLALALLASVAITDAASANPRMGGVVVAPQVSFPRVSPPTNYGSTAGTDAGRSAVDAARSGTGSAVFGPTVGGIGNAPNYGNSGGGGGGGALGLAVNNTIGSLIGAGGYGSKAPASGGNFSDFHEQRDFHHGCKGCGKTSDADEIAGTFLAIGLLGSDTKAPPDSTTKVANTAPTTGVTSAAPPSPLPGPTGSTTKTTKPPIDPPDAKPPLTQAQHQQLVDTAKNLDNNWKNLDNQYNQQQDIIIKATGSGTLTPAEKKILDDAGGVKGLEKQREGTANQRDAKYKEYQGAQNEAKKNDSYRYVQ